MLAKGKKKMREEVELFKRWQTARGVIPDVNRFRVVPRRVAKSSLAEIEEIDEKNAY